MGKKKRPQLCLLWLGKSLFEKKSEKTPGPTKHDKNLGFSCL